MDLDIYTWSLRHSRLHYRDAFGLVEQFESDLREVANDFARRERDIRSELIRGGRGISA